MQLPNKIIIEESFYGQNIKTFQMLSRLGGFVYAIAQLNNITDVKFLLATTARKNLGFKGNAKKEIIQKEFIQKLELKVEDNDIIDAMILVMNGIILKETNIPLLQD
jgi:Holliday junction resolvasome RuvABC endonuclease subunit